MQAFEDLDGAEGIRSLRPGRREPGAGGLARVLRFSGRISGLCLAGIGGGYDRRVTSALRREKPLVGVGLVVADVETRRRGEWV